MLLWVVPFPVRAYGYTDGWVWQWLHLPSYSPTLALHSFTWLHGLEFATWSLKALEEMTQRAGFMPVYRLGVLSCVCSEPSSCCFANPRGCGDEDSYGVGSPSPVEKPVCFNSKNFLDLSTGVDKKNVQEVCFCATFLRNKDMESAINKGFVGTLTLGQMSCLQSDA